MSTRPGMAWWPARRLRKFSRPATSVRRLRLSESAVQAFKIVKVHGATDEVLARIEICKAAFEKALFVYPKEHLDQGRGSF